MLNYLNLILSLLIIPSLLLRSILVRYYGFGLRKLAWTYLKNGSAMRVQFVLVFFSILFVPMFMLPLYAFTDAVVNKLALTAAPRAQQVPNVQGFDWS